MRRGACSRPEPRLIPARSNTMQTHPAQERPLPALPPRGVGLPQRIWATLGVLMFAGFLGAMVVYTGPALVSDWQVRDAVEPAERGRIIKGFCTTKLVFAICDVTLSNRTPSGTV